MRVLNDSTVLAWRALAKDGMDLPADQAVEGPSEVQMGNGETYDFDFVPRVPGDIRLDVTTGAGDLLVSMPIRVRESSLEFDPNPIADRPDVRSAFGVLLRRLQVLQHERRVNG